MWRQEGFNDGATVDLVVARFREDLTWLKRLDARQFRRIIVYNKGGDNLQLPFGNARVVSLPNVGREVHTYLWHIVHSWDDLADTTVFLPGSSDLEHKWPLAKRTVEKALKERGRSAFVVRRVEDVREELWDFAIDEWQSTSKANATVNPEKRLAPCEERPFGRWFEKNFGRITVSGVAYYGIFAAGRGDVRRGRSKEDYARLMQYVDKSSNPEAGHYFERAWLAVFHPVGERDMVDDQKL